MMKNINSTGQLASLDLLIMLLSLFLALGMISGFTELNFVSLKESSDRSALHSYAENAFTILTSNSPVSCKFEDQVIVPNCLVDSGTPIVISNNDLHLPPSVTFSISGLNHVSGPGAFIDPSSSYIELQKSVLLVNFDPKGSPNLFEKRYSECVSDSASCSLSSQIVTLRVWVQ